MPPSDKPLIGSITQLTHTPPTLSEVLTHHRDKVKVKSIINYDALIARAQALESALAQRTEDLKRCADALRTIDAWLASPHPLTKSEMQSLVAQALRGDPTLGFSAALTGERT